MIEINKSERQCFTRLSTESEEMGHKEIISIYIDGEFVVKFGYSQLWYYSAIEDSIESIWGIQVMDKKEHLRPFSYKDDKYISILLLDNYSDISEDMKPLIGYFIKKIKVTNINDRHIIY